MIKLNKRLLTMAKEVCGSKVVADIGCDHGYLPIYLKQNNLVEKVIMADISKESLSKAINTWKEEFPNEKGDFRVGDGLEVLKIGEASSVTIAGMGGILMTEILGWNNQITASIDKLVLQPRSNVKELRIWLYNNGFNIEKELLVKEGKFICEILTVKVPHKIKPQSDKIDICEGSPLDEKSLDIEIEYEFPSYLIDFEDKELLKEYLNRQLLKNENIRNSIEKGVDKSKLANSIEYQKANYRIKRLKRLLELAKG